jgi:LCP family protein required for cell wall assembly
LNQAVYQGPPRRGAPSGGARSGRSGAVAGLLSFIFPGLGHAYLGRRREALIFAVPVLVVLGALLVWIGTSGLARAGAKLLDPRVALTFAWLALAIGIWWILAIVSAARSATNRGPSALVPIGLIIVVLLASLSGANWAYRISLADPSLTQGIDCTIQNCNAGSSGAPIGSNGLIGGLPSYMPASAPPSGVQDTAQPTDDGSCDGDYCTDPSEPPATIEPGPSPSFDITTVDAKDDGWLNVLLLGLDTRCVGQGVVTGANTDSMIVVSVNAATNKVYMFSFPRDTAQFPLYIGGTMPGYWKLNTFAGYTKGYPDTFSDPGQPALADEIGFLLGIPIDYFASINICGFPQLIDAIGGVDVCNTKTIDDPSYPRGDGTAGFHLDAGEYHMNGATALAYARSRHGSSDFARAKRQQQLLSAIRQSLLSPANIANLPNIITAMGDVVHTNFPPDQIDQLLSVAGQVDANPTQQYVFDFPDWAQHLPRTETNGRSVQFLKMDAISALSQQIFGDKSQYTGGGGQPVPSATPPQPSPTDTPPPGGTPC